MSLKLKDIILDDVHALVRQLTGFEENQDNFKACERFIMSNLINHRFLSVDGHAIRRSIEGMVMKFQVHALPDKGQELDSLVKQFLASSDFKDSAVDIEWSLLSLLLHLGENPTNPLRAVENDSGSSILFSDDEEKDFDWAAYLKEGDEDFHQNWSDTSTDEDEDEVDCMVATKPELIVNQSQPQSMKSSLSESAAPLLESEDSFISKKTSHSVASNAATILTSESWLRSNIQHDWWGKAHYEEKRLSNLPASCDLGSTKGIKNSTLSEHKIVMEVIWFLTTPFDSAVFMRVISDDGMKSHFCVRPHITIPSLSQDVFSSFLNSVCAYADMIEELQTFCSGLYEGTRNNVCATYEAYGLALQSEMRPVFEALTVLEKRAHRQSDTLTLLLLMKELSPKLSIIVCLHKLHKSGVLDWKKNPNWLCAIHLLSVLLISLRGGGENIDMNFRVFVRTFQVYMKIVDQWLSSGQLYDTREEFFITQKEKKNSNLGATFEKRDWEKEIAVLGVESPQALQILVHCLLKSAQPLHVVSELKQLTQLRKLTSTICSFECLFLESLIRDLELSQIGKINLEEEDKKNSRPSCESSGLVSEVESPNSNKTPTIPSGKSLLDVEAVLNQMHGLNDPCLMKEFQALFHCPMGIPPSNSHQEEAEMLLLEKCLLLSHSSPEYLPLELCVERAILSLSRDWEGIAGALAADLMIRECHLLHHMHTAQSVFLLQASHKLNPFLSHLFTLILHRKNQLWMNSHTLSVLLQDCMDSEQIMFSVNLGNKDPTEVNSFECIDSMQLNYKVEWPVCAIINEENQNTYNFVLRLLLKIRWGLWLLEKLNIKDVCRKDNSSVSQRLLYLRHWLLLDIRSTFSFLAGHVLNSLWLKFEEDVRSSKDMNTIIEVHARFLQCALQQSLNAHKANDPIKNALFQLVALAENLHSLWTCDLSKIPSSKLDNIEECYRACHQFLAASLHTMAERNGHEHLTALSDYFNWNMPAIIV